MNTLARRICDRPNGTPDIDQVDGVQWPIVMAKDPIVESDGRVREWLAFAGRCGGMLPPGLATDDGFIVNGNHRMEAARTLGHRLWCNVVEQRNGEWVATGLLICLE